MKKKLISKLMVGVLTFALLAGIQVFPVMADSTIVCTLGADLTAEQQTAILQYFGVYGNPAVQIMYINNQNERDLLGSWIPLEQIGTRTISCALVKPTTSGGIQVRTANLNYITSNMIASNLATAGITNCEVVAAAPFEVSGTGALTGILMAYEKSTSTTLDQTKSDVAVQELVTTSDLASKVGQQEAQQIVNDIKLQIIEGNLESTDVEQVNQIVNNVITNYIDDSTTSIEVVDGSYTDNSSTVNNTTTVNENTLSQQDIINLQILASSLAAQSYDDSTKDVIAQIQATLEEQTQKTSSAATQEIVNNVESNTVDFSNPTGDNAVVLNDDSILNKVNTEALSDGGLIESATDQSMISDNSVNLDQVISDTYNQPGGLTPEQLVQEEAMNQQAIEEMQALGIPLEGDLSAVTGDGATDGSDNTNAVAEAAPAGTVNFTNDQRGTDYKFKVQGTETTLGQITSGINLISLELPYNDLKPVSGTLTVTDSNGVQVASLDLATASSSQISTIAENGSISRPAEWFGYTAIQMLPYDDYTGTAFSEVEGTVYTFTLTDAVFASADTSVTVNCSRSGEYAGAAGFSIPGIDLNSICKDSFASGVVYFPVDSTYAEVSIDNDKMYAESFCTYSDTGAVNLNFTGKGKSTLILEYYDYDSSANSGADPLYKVEYTLYIQ